MASIKLNNSIRNHIVDLLLDHKYTPLSEKMDKEENTLAEKVYCAVFPKKERDVIDSLKEGWLRESKDMYVRLYPNGYGLRMHFGNEEKRRFPHDTGNTINLPDIIERKGVEALNDKILEHMEEKEALGEECKQTRLEALSLLSSVTTVNRAIEVWPEAEQFIREAVGVVQKSNASVPALLAETLNFRLGLPPKD